MIRGALVQTLLLESLQDNCSGIKSLHALLRVGERGGGRGERGGGEGGERDKRRWKECHPTALLISVT